MRFDIGPVTAPTLTGLTAVAGVRAIVLAWDVPNDSKHAKTRVYYATVNNTAAATLVAEVSGNTFTHTGLSTSTRYYWVRSVNVYGREDGGWSAVASIGSTLLTELDIAASAVKAAALDVAGIDPATGKVIASQVAAGTLAAGVVYAGTITASQISASTLSAISANLGSVTAGEITGTADINITGNARFRGAYSGADGIAAVYANESKVADNGLISYSDSGGAVLGIATSGAVYGVRGVGSGGADGVHGAAGTGGIGGYFTNSNGYALYAGPNPLSAPVGPVTVLWCDGDFKFGSYTYSAPSGSSTTALLANGTWGNPHSAFATTAAETRNSSGASLWCNAHQAVLQTDGNFVVYNSGTPVGSSSGGFPSDARLKKNIIDSTLSGLSVVEAWKVKDYKWRSGTPMGAQNQLVQTGFIAQQVAEITPGLVSEVAGTLLLNKTEMIPYMAKAIQELSAQIRQLKGQLNLA